MDGRHFAKFVLSYIRKNGDTFENEEASRMLAELNEEDVKRKEMAKPAPEAAPTPPKEETPPIE